MRLPSAVLLTIACGLVRAAAGAEYFVSEEGDDGELGTKDSPWATIQHAIDSIDPGDTVTVLPGIYREKPEFNRSGKKGSPLTLKAAGDVTINGKRTIGDHLLSIYNQDYIHVIGFELTDNRDVDDGSGIRVEGECAGIEIRDNKVHNVRGQHAMGITVYGTSSAKPITGLVIDGNEIYDCDPAESEALVLNGNIDGFEVTNNVVRDVNNIGIDFIGGEKSICKDTSLVARNGVCRGNRVERARSSYGGGFAAGIYVDGGKDILIEKNVVTQCDMGIEIGAENKHASTTGIVVRDNLIYLNDKAGIVFGGYSKKAGTVSGCRFENNICETFGLQEHRPPEGQRRAVDPGRRRQHRQRQRLLRHRQKADRHRREDGRGAQHPERQHLLQPRRQGSLWLARQIPRRVVEVFRCRAAGRRRKVRGSKVPRS